VETILSYSLKVRSTPGSMHASARVSTTTAEAAPCRMASHPMVALSGPQVVRISIDLSRGLLVMQVGHPYTSTVIIGDAGEKKSRRRVDH
jgi:hypothetical protein